MSLIFRICLIVSLHTAPLTSLAAPVKFVAMELEPYGMQSLEGEAGIFYDILARIGDRIPEATTVRVFNVARAIRDMKKGLADCSLFIINIDGDKPLINVASIGWNMRSVVLARKEVSIKSYEDLYGLRLAVARGSRFNHPLDTDPKLEKTLTAHYRQSLTLLVNNRVDAVVGTEASLSYLIQTMGFENNRFSHPLVLHTKPISLYCRENTFSSSGLDNLRSVVKAMRDSGEIRQIIGNYFQR